MYKRERIVLTWLRGCSFNFTYRPLIFVRNRVRSIRSEDNRDHVVFHSIMWRPYLHLKAIIGEAASSTPRVSFRHVKKSWKISYRIQTAYFIGATLGIISNVKN